MDGNHSLLAVDSHLIHCADAQTPLIINIILGLPANICVILLILAGPGDKVAEIFPLNQAVCEVVICMTNVIALIAINILRSGGDVAFFTCLWYTMRFSFGFLFSGRPLFMCCICLERYFAVVHPVAFLKYKLLKYKLAGSIISWLIVLACCIILVWIPYPDIYYVAVAMAFTWFPVQLFCCVETVRVLVRPGPGDRNQEINGKRQMAKVKALKIIITITITVGLAHLPFVISVISYGQISKEDSSKMFCVATYVALIVRFIPPALYIHRVGKLCVKGTT